jgi:hypothetical protein
MGMRIIPPRGERGDYDAVVVRTDYSGETGWRGALAALEAGDTSDLLDEPLPWSYVIVEGPDWAGVSIDDIIDAAAPDEDLSIVFVADRRTMEEPEHPFLAVTVDDPADENYRETIQYGREFRILPGLMPQFHANIDISNMGFEEFAAVAQKDTEGVFRGFDD